MIRSISIKNYRCFEQLQLDRCARINMIVGDNGSGKTALLEALFLALGASPEIAVRFRQQRGLEGTYSGSPRRIEEALWRDLFFSRNWTRPIFIELTGDGPEARRVTVSRSPGGEVTIPLEAGPVEESALAPLTFEWCDSRGRVYQYKPRVTAAGVQMPSIQEDVPDFFYFAASQPISATENAQRFSDLSRVGKIQPFIKLITSEYSWINDLSIELTAGSAAIFAAVDGLADKIPLPNASGAINRVVAVLLAIMSRQQSVVLVDEIENGLFFQHHPAIWRALIMTARDYDAQLFLSTHSAEWLEAVSAATDDTSDVALWRVQRSKQGPRLHQFAGPTFIAGIESGGEVR
jgi:AAA domain/AAA domain, putative AbiEii toxin, Type IV TA system